MRPLFVVALLFGCLTPCSGQEPTRISTGLRSVIDTPTVPAISVPPLTQRNLAVPRQGVPQEVLPVPMQPGNPQVFRQPGPSPRFTAPSQPGWHLGDAPSTDPATNERIMATVRAAKQRVMEAKARVAAVRRQAMKTGQYPPAGNIRSFTIHGDTILEGPVMNGPIPTLIFPSGMKPPK